MTLHAAVPTLPVRDVAEAQAQYRDTLGFDIAWHNIEGRIGAVRRGDCVLFLRETDGPITPLELWVFCDDVDGTEADLTALGADISDPISDKPWGLRSFTVRDPSGHLIHFHHDLWTAA
ncbi:putative glyoxalase superfamily protein PhnB [Maritimibacter alkaliphilus HTCC2654]|uniref:Bleomycin resistance protein n=1 Tax=Maritimibacter alkaliphilus HTCC2654 TaxID=314271 RepID=A3VBA6_9RHOB|nr:glyoxalase/bleomycin resistance/extradiol dioxygenase family protein [Maritimibacter alkaliphilus]EAQ14239.1 bleomycin resistance protein [Rhodobacterales bacterium HTCC2654] [Maritimibacter alkaliphilus HTCC2654]TYP82621.1 putative glyoxalase superfamily protein PhnB [Maritimibacter alkaliphilus HTCC2654]